MIAPLRIPVFILLAVVLSACDGNTQKQEEMPNMDTTRSSTRPSALAGSWYPADPTALRNSIDQYMKHAKAVSAPGTILGIVAPHAGHVYSGPVAAYAYRQIQGKQFDTVVVIAPNHVDPRLRFSSVLTHGAYATPLGIVPVDTATAEAMVNHDPADNVQASELGHLSGYSGRMEHAIEIQLPFLQYTLGEFSLAPVVMGGQDPESVAALARAIVAAVRGRNALIVGSSDLSHFFPAQEARGYDERVKGYIEAYDIDGLLADDGVEKSHVCGRGPIAVAMLACRELGANRATVLRMANSGDVSGDAGSVVGYLAAAFSASPESGGEEDSASEPTVGVNLGLTSDEKDILRNVVLQTLNSVVRTRQTPRFDNFSGNLGEHRGAFVTLTRRGDLRGCIGNIVGTQPLISTVAEMTRAAALKDPRFSPVRPEELPEIEFEISVLTPIRRVKDTREIVVGRDGIIITRGYNRGLLLPQVATEYGWDLETFLEQTCRKAGLPRDAWKDPDTVIEAFSAEIFH